MTFCSIRELRNDSKMVWDTIAQGKEVVITNNGKPSALMINISEDNFEEIIKMISQIKAMNAFKNMREHAAKKGFLSDEEIEAEIQAARKERK